MRHVVLLASTPYAYLHHRFQKIADELRRLGIPVTYVEQTRGWRKHLAGPRRAFVREVLRSVLLHCRAFLPLPRKRSLAGLPDFHAGMPLHVLEMPLVIPTNRRDSRCVERLNARVLRRLLLDTILPWTGPGSGCVALIDNPFWVNALRKGDVERMYYDCIDDVRLYAGRAAVDRWRSYERDLLSMCDGAFATAAALEEQIRADAPALPVERVPNGVDSAWFRARVLRESPPADLARLPRPLIGYVGTISDWLDYGSVTALARLLPTHSFVFVGPIDYASRRAELCTAPNIHWLGRKAYEDVPAYIGAFDVCWIPFAQGPIVEHTNPIKLFEYFALGRPVVTTPMPEVLPFTGGGLVYIGQTPQELAGALEAARTGDSAAAQSRRRAVAEEHGWDRLVGRMLAAMQGEVR